MFDATDACEMRQDDELIYGLMMDLQPAIIRIENELYVYNPLEAQIKSEYPEGVCTVQTGSICYRKGNRP